MRIYLAANYHDNQSGIFDNLEDAIRRADQEHCECVEVYELSAGEFQQVETLYLCRVCKQPKSVEDMLEPVDYWNGRICIPCYQKSPVELPARYQPT